MSSAYWSSADLKGTNWGGQIRESVMDRIFDISRIPLPFQDMVGSGTARNEFHEWSTHRLSNPNIGNAQVDGRDSTANDAKARPRVGNRAQISTKDVQVTQRAQNSDVIAVANELARQVIDRQQELRRDVDAICVTSQASQADDGNTTPGKTGGLGACISTNSDFGATGSAGGFVSGGVNAPTFGTKRAWSFAKFKDLAQAVYVGGGNPTVAMSVPNVIRKISEYMFSSTAQIATLEGKTSADGGRDALTAKGAVNVFVSDFGVTMELRDNRLQQLENGAENQANLYMLDPQYLRLDYMQRYRVDPLAKTGLADKRMMSVDYVLAVLNQEAHALYADIDPALAGTA